MNEYKKNNYNELNQQLIEDLKKLQSKMKQIQDEFDFVIPDYILQEIVQKEKRYIKENINALINLAKLNNRLSINQARILKSKIIFN